jgi:hypothetical protein
VVACSSFSSFSSPSTAAGMDPNGLKTGGTEISLYLSVFLMNFISLFVFCILFRTKGDFFFVSIFLLSFRARRYFVSPGPV